MRILVSILVLSAFVLAGCGGLRDSRANPANWFGKSSSKNVVTTEAGTQGQPTEVNPLIAGGRDSQLIAANATTLQRTGLLRRRAKVVPYEGTLVDQVTDLRIERTASGAIIHATALTQRQGAYDVRLVKEGSTDDGVLVYGLRAMQPIDTQQGPQRTRTINVADFVSTQDLEAVSAIRVVANRNTRTSRR